MRPRDVRAIGFCSVSILVLLVVSLLLSGSFSISLALTAGYAAWVLTRPRMMRVYRRLRGEPTWGGYYDNEATRPPVSRGPGTAASPPRPAERP